MNLQIINPKLGKKIAILLFYIMFLYSGFKKIPTFSKKVNVLQNKTHLPHLISVFGIIVVIILEIIGSLIIITNALYPKTFNQKVEKIIYLLFLIFLIVVTAIYHPPTDKIIPFLSNVTTFAGILYLYCDLF